MEGGYFFKNEKMTLDHAYNEQIETLLEYRCVILNVKGSTTLDVILIHFW